jgi:hypothetical protein
VNHIIRLERDIAEDVNVSLSLTKNFVNPVECSQSCGMQLRLTPSEGEYKEEMGENMIIINTKKAAGRNNSPGSGS